jgi:DNA-binding NarL/FixJ family response regulator
VRLKRRSARPRVVLYSGRGGQLLTVAPAVAGVDAVVAKSDSVPALLEAIRDAARDTNPPRAVSLGLQARAAARIDPADHAILAMRLAGTTWAEIAATLRIPTGAVTERAAAIAIRLTTTPAPDMPAPALA